MNDGLNIVMCEDAQRITTLVGRKPVSQWTGSEGKTTEWQIPATCLARLSADLKASVAVCGGRMYDVDCSYEPYYFVGIRHHERAAK